MRIESGNLILSENVLFRINQQCGLDQEETGSYFIGDIATGEGFNLSNVPNDAIGGHFN